MTGFYWQCKILIDMLGTQQFFVFMCLCRVLICQESYGTIFYYTTEGVLWLGYCDFLVKLLSYFIFKLLPVVLLSRV
jgi:hypothetical protein